MRKIRPTIVLYCVAALWMMVASVYRVMIMITKGQDIDVVPFISMMIGITLLSVVLTQERNRTHE